MSNETGAVKYTDALKFTAINWKVRTTSDTLSYVRIANDPLWEVKFYTNTRPFVFPHLVPPRYLASQSLPMGSIPALGE